MVEMLSGGPAAGNSGVPMPYYLNWFLTLVAGHRFQGVPATPGEPVRFVREPDNAADPNAIAVHDAYGRRIGYVFREIAADYAALIDLGLVGLSGRLVAVGEPAYDAGRALTNPRLIVNIHADPARLDAFLARWASG